LTTQSGRGTVAARWPVGEGWHIREEDGEDRAVAVMAACRWCGRRRGHIWGRREYDCSEEGTIVVVPEDDEDEEGASRLGEMWLV
jgi:hypothetical protein